MGKEGIQLLLVDLCDSRLNPDALEFRPKPLSSTQVDTKEGVGPTQVPPVTSMDLLASSREKVAKSRCNSQQVHYLKVHKEELLLCGCVEGKEAEFVIDMGVDVTLISLIFLETLRKLMHITFQDRSHVLYLADGKTMVAKGSALCNVTV